MGSYRERGPAGGDRGTSGNVAGYNGGDTTRNLAQAQTDSLKRLAHLRRDTNLWRAKGCTGQPPQPGWYGLRLGELRSTEIWWASP